MSAKLPTQNQLCEVEKGQTFFVLVPLQHDIHAIHGPGLGGVANASWGWSQEGSFENVFNDIMDGSLARDPL